MEMLAALAEGGATPVAMAELARGKLRSKRDKLAQALSGRLTENHRFLLYLHLRQLDRLEADTARLDDRIADKMSPYRKQQKLLTQIPGVDDLAHLKTTLVMSAMSAARTRGSYYKDKYYRLKARCGGVKAAMAIAHKTLIAVFHMLANNAPFQELGAAYLDQRSKHRVTKALVRRLGILGYDVLLQPKAA
ncbi:MAG TPA: hypothetical protein VKI44_40165 [Acetobacteraceae bacterium]|nr:hypothetical protein [Acetobacteraceae bacterium]